MDKTEISLEFDKIKEIWTDCALKIGRAHV